MVTADRVTHSDVAIEDVASVDLHVGEGTSPEPRLLQDLQQSANRG